MKPIEDGERCRDRAGYAPKHDIVVVELDLIHVVFFNAKRIRHPKTDVDENKQGHERSARLTLFYMRVASEHFQSVYNEYCLKS